MWRSRDFIVPAPVRKIALVSACVRGWRVLMAARTRVAVIGAGIVGVTTASFLLRKGHDVVLLDPG
ncbi:MAG TPA: FAD-dependent oxidoreductase, partial [Hyphomicrobiaceae bacterium]|nr:FAD-dependent oxidoreductase [Hyphomicrobiaceae bacterium]